MAAISGRSSPVVTPGTGASESKSAARARGLAPPMQPARLPLRRRRRQASLEGECGALRPEVRRHWPSGMWGYGARLGRGETDHLGRRPSVQGSVAQQGTSWGYIGCHCCLAQGRWLGDTQGRSKCHYSFGLGHRSLSLLVEATSRGRALFWRINHKLPSNTCGLYSEALLVKHLGIYFPIEPTAVEGPVGVADKPCLCRPAALGAARSALA